MVNKSGGFLSFEKKQWGSISNANSSAVSLNSITGHKKLLPAVQFLLLFGSAQCFLWTANPNIWTVIQNHGSRQAALQAGKKETERKTGERVNG